MKTVVILDNGEEWSDHTIEFVDCGRFTVAEVQRLWAAAHGGCWTMVAVAKDPDWREPKALTQVHEAIFPQGLVNRNNRGLSPSPRLGDLGVPVVKKLMAAWHRHFPGGWEPGECLKVIEKWLKSQKG